MVETDSTQADTSTAANDGNIPAEQGKTFSPADVDRIVNDRLKADRASLEKDLGMSTEGMKLKDIKAILKAHKDAEDAKKSELDRISEQNKSMEGELSTTKAELLKLKIAIDAQIPADKLPTVLKYVSGRTEDEIKASMVEVKADLGLVAPPTPTDAQGAGNPGVPGAPAQKKIWKESEIKELRLSGKLTDELMAEIRQATNEGRVQ